MGTNSDPSVSSVEQWDLFASVLPAFGPHLRWTASRTKDAQGKQDIENELVKNHSLLFSNYIMEIPVIVTATSRFKEESRQDFEIEVDILLRHLEALVDKAVLPASAVFSQFSPSHPKYPNLSALRILVEQGDSSAFYDSGRYLLLRQQACDMKIVSYKFKTFIKWLGDLRMETRPPPGIQTPTAHYEEKFNHGFGHSSQCLFDSLVTHFKPCDDDHAERQAKDHAHTAMLHLKLFSRARDSFAPTELAMKLASCPDQQGWHQIVCTIPTAIVDRDSSAVQANPNIISICEEAKTACRRQKAFKIELQGTGFQDLSDSVCDIVVEHQAHPTKTLSDLLNANVLKGQYLFPPYDRRMLAFTLAQALLHLYQGSWIQTLWTPQFIFFDYDTSKGTVRNIHQPYISCILSRNNPPLDPLDEGHPEPLILSFARLLVELHTGEVMKIGKRDNDGTPSLLLSLREYYTLEGHYQYDSLYAQAFKACVYFPKYLKEDRLLDPETTIHDVILKNIVRPLESRLSKDQKLEVGPRSLDFESAISVSEQSGLSRQSSIGTYDSSVPRLSESQNSKLARGSSKARSRRGGSLHVTGQEVRPLTISREDLNVFKQSQKKGQALDVAGATFRRPSTNCRKHTVLAEPDRPLNPRRSNRTDLFIKRPEGDPHSTEERQGSNHGFQTASSTPHGEKAGNSYPGAVDSASIYSSNIQRESISTRSFKYINGTVDKRLLHKDKDKAIKVAVLDTGFDRHHEDFKQARAVQFVGEFGNISEPAPSELPQYERVVEFRDFCCGNEDNDVEDLDGHGTKVAGIILRLAPHANLLIARVCLGDDTQVPEHQERFKKPQPDIVAQAVKWAIEKEVDIINISLGFRHKSHNQLSHLRDALTNAQKHNIAVFAATSNEGNHQTVAWPAKDSAFAIGVHSCTDNGTKSDSAAPPSRDGANFMVVGENIMSHRLTSRDGGFSVCNGASFATPVASAIGALILAFVSQAVCAPERKKSREAFDPDDVYSNNGMIKVLKEISRTDSNAGYHFIQTQLFWADYRPHTDSSKDEKQAKQHAWRKIESALRA